MLTFLSSPLIMQVNESASNANQKEQNNSKPGWCVLGVQIRVRHGMPIVG
jgi:hypothetical protein